MERKLRVGVTAVLALFLSIGAVGCGSDESRPAVASDPTAYATPQPALAEEPACEVEFEGTFDAIQTVIFERHGCIEAACHDSAAAGGLSLGPSVAYANLVGVEASVGGVRVMPGSTRDSVLWLKLAAAADPEHYPVAGSGMPIGGPPVEEALVELLRLWIFAGAPESGTVDKTERFIDGCLPEPKPLNIAPLVPPSIREGVQFVMPPFDLEPGREVEVCFAAYYDFRGQVPPEALDETGTRMRWQRVETGQDPQSHHLQLLFSGVQESEIHDPAFGEWKCRGGDRAGELCDPLDTSGCNDGLCGSTVEDSIACAGFGPPTRQLDGRGGQFVAANAGQPREERTFPDGLYLEIPVFGVYFWNSHAFNLTVETTSMDARINFHFADKQDAPIFRVRAIDSIFLPNNLPFTRERFCADYVVPQGARIFMLSSHTHGRGEHFTVEDHEGELLYENFLYNEPFEKYFDPPLAYDSPDPAQRTLRYCGVFNNGLDFNGEPDSTLVTRASKTPENAFAACTPVACAEGRLGASCAGEGDDSTCDTSPGAGDGRCDACRISGGVSTENEMFILTGQYYFAYE